VNHNEEIVYGAYLIRFWRETATTPWRFLLVCVHTGQRRTFTSLESVFCYLDELLYMQPVEEKNG
jgi:hypothetical protein